MGLGFVGLTTALGFAEKEHSVLGFDTDSARSIELCSGNVSFCEPGLSEALARNIGNNFNVTSTLSKASTDIQAVFICVGTPASDDGSTDLQYVLGAIDNLEPIIKKKSFNGIIVIKSTVPPGSTKNIIIPYLREKDIKVPVANNPEFLREGYCWEDFMNPDRIVCGVDDAAAANILKCLYSDFNAPLIITSLNTAEFTKYLSNNMLASMISFSNEMSIIAKAIGDISIKEAFETLHMDRRWAGSSMKSYVYPGCGFGGYCLPKDLEAMIAHANNYGIKPVLLESVQEINRSMPSFFIEEIIKGNPESIGILGLSFKPGTNDVRDSPAAPIIAALKDKALIYAFDPAANAAFRERYQYTVNYCESADEVCEHAKTVMIVTAWPEFKEIDKRWSDVKFVDGRYMF